MPSRVIERLREYVDTNLDARIAVKAMSALAELSLSYFAHCFRNSTGLTPHAFVMQRRLARARELIVTTDLSMADIALASGYTDQSHLTRRFHSGMGRTPAACRLTHRRARLAAVMASFEHTSAAGPGPRR